jgi:uncharacterized membrane protein YphA (DoxX/SURF4 family)
MGGARVFQRSFSLILRLDEGTESDAYSLEVKMKLFALLGRVLFGLIFIVASPRHFSHEGVLDALGRGVPLAGLLVPISGALALAGGISILIGWRAQ